MTLGAGESDSGLIRSSILWWWWWQSVAPRQQLQKGGALAKSSPSGGVLDVRGGDNVT